MLWSYNVHVTTNRGKNSRFPEHHWVASSMIYAFHPTTFFQLGVNRFLTRIIVHRWQVDRVEIGRYRVRISGGAHKSYIFFKGFNE